MQTVELIYGHFPELTQKQQDQFAALFDLYKEWNAKINVISRKDLDSLRKSRITFLGIAKIYSFGQKVMDVGTKQVPGIPLAILSPETQFHLVDSIKKLRY